MLLVREASGPHQAAVGQQVTFSVTRYNHTQVTHEEAGRVSWLVKSAEGVALTNLHRQGPTLTLTIPASWAGQSLLVMPYMNSASTRISVRTRIEDAPVNRETPESVSVQVFKEDRRYYASVNGAPRFYVGSDVRYGSRRGLMNSANPFGPRYSPEHFVDEAGHWAHYLHPTIQCESKGAFNCINTYDRARFTYGHMQFAAHTANSNFTLLFRELLGLPEAVAYFPDLTVRSGHIHRIGDNGQEPLEDNDSTEPLQLYLNPNSQQVEELAVVVAAKFLAWCATDQRFVRTLAEFAFRDQQEKLKRHARKLPLDGLSDKLCMVVLDILHQGRGKYSTIKKALVKPDPFDALLNIGLDTYRERIATLRSEMLRLESRGLIGFRAYDGALARFVSAEGA